MTPSATIREILMRFSHNDREYCVFSLEDTTDTFLYFAHRERPLRALFFGSDFRNDIARLVRQSDLCIECGLGMQIRGGVSLDGTDVVAVNITFREANAIITSLQNRLDPDGKWIASFPSHEVA